MNPPEIITSVAVIRVSLMSHNGMKYLRAVIQIPNEGCTYEHDNDAGNSRHAAVESPYCDNGVLAECKDLLFKAIQVIPNS